MQPMSWTDRSKLDLYGKDVQVERATEGQASPRQYLMIPTVSSGGVLVRGGSGYEQAETELCRVEGDEVAVALGPPA
ncbi:hypothetical protein GCM10023176_62180 [Micromonospora coerulea]|uniref:Uncharacterized protein n=1 Tax=Micromonospora coerulea TaxID=47856 RepID=A0ABP8T7V4_9ACTN